MSTPTFTLPVRELVALTCNQGDIDNRFWPSPTAQEGTEGHSQVARRRGEGWQKEVAVEQCFPLQACRLRIRGRADLVHPARRIVEEIKTLRVDPDQLPSHVRSRHLDQGKCYAALLCDEHDWEQVDVVQTWLDLRDNREHQHTHSFSRQELGHWLAARLERVAHWLVQVAQHRQQRQQDLETLQFPYPDYRHGQRQLAVATWRTIEQRRLLLAEAPTGIGKTLAVMFPALKAMSRPWHSSVLFLTARNVGKRAALDTIEQIKGHGLAVRELTLSGRERICLTPGAECSGESCPYAKGYYARNGAARSQLLSCPDWREQTLLKVAREHTVCPHRIQFELLPWADAVIADYNYLFNSRGSISGLLQAFDCRVTLLVDEVHNLLGRSRELYSASLEKTQVMAIKKTAPATIAKAAQGINRQLLALKRDHLAEQTHHASKEIPTALLGALHRFLESCQLHWQQQQDGPAPDLLAFFFACQRFVETAELFNAGYVCQLQQGMRKSELSVGLKCLDPAPLLAQRWRETHATVLFSATLSPLDYTRVALGLPDNSYQLQLASPFPPGRLKLLITADLSARYQQRQASLDPLCRTIADVYHARPGNYLVFFPSHRYLQQVAERFGQSYPSLPLTSQPVRASAEEQQIFIDRYRHRKDGGIIGFAVLGGMFSEGLDLPGTQLLGAIVVSTGLPQINPGNELLKTYYQDRYHQGFDFAYRYPGLQKVIQAAGRVIRTGTDNGVVILADDRFTQPSQSALLPAHWQRQTCRVTDIAEILTDFWSSQDSEEQDSDPNCTPVHPR